MSTKPSVLPLWGESATNEAEPSAGLKASGHPYSTPYVSSHGNWRARITTAWLRYLSDGNFDAPITIAWPGTPGTFALTVGGNTLVSGDLGTTGDVVAGANLIANTGDVRAAGDVKFGEIRSRRIPGASARSIPLSAHTLTLTGHTVQTNDAIVYPLFVEVGDQIDGWLVWITKTSNGSQTLQARLGYVLESTGVATYVGSPATATNNANNPGRTALVKAGLAHNVVGDASYFLECAAFNGGGIAAGADTFLGAELNYSRPA
jgi:hypothetical protein